MENNLNKVRIIHQCHKAGLSVWQCPQFLFLIMGLIIMAVSVISYLVGTSLIDDPLFITLIDLIATGILFVISFVIIGSFEKLAEASRMKTEFISIVSHQLRSPVTNIKWTLDFLFNEEISKSKKDGYYGNIKDNIDRILELIDELLIVSRIEQGSFPVREKEANLKDITKDLVSRFKVFAEASGVKLNFDCEKFPDTVFDPVLLKLVIENLIDNAIKYTVKGGNVDISLSKSKKDLSFKIKDSGVGIPEYDQKHIFKKFFRSENSLKEKTRGSGLGLYICKIIIEKSKGKIWFESKENKGTTFFFTIPNK